MAQPLILKRASASRQSGQWRDDDYDVLEDGVRRGGTQFYDMKTIASATTSRTAMQARVNAPRRW